MANQAHYEPMEASPFFADGSSARTPPAGTIARGHLDTDPALHHGREPGSRDAVKKSPLPPTHERLRRGRELFNIHCAVCHGEDGYGNGIVVRRGFPAPPSYHSDRLRNAPDGHIFDVITNGYGMMYPLRSQVAVRDRWAIVNYIRALQLGQHARLADVRDPDARRKLAAERRTR
jgi:mono/diheme cytochrome c family protein